MGRLKQELERYKKEVELYKATPEYKKSMTIKQMKQIENIAKVFHDALTNDELEKLRQKWRELKKSIDKN